MFGLTDSWVRLALLLTMAADGGPPAGATTSLVPPSTSAAGELAARWSAQKTPAAGAARAIGAYAGGCLQGAVRLPRSGPGYEVMRPSRRRYFAHPAMIAFVRRFAAAAKQRRLGPVIVGDIAQARGGPTPSGHRSHQTGLDADLGYAAPRGMRAGRLKATDRERLGPVVVVDQATKTPTAQWNARVARLVALAAADPAVDRVFVNPVVKRALCADPPSRIAPTTAWMSRVRPWWAHHDHFHVRLRCPEGDESCASQEPLLPTDDGCGASLDWWFSDDAEVTRLRRQAPTTPDAPAGPVLPEACQALLEGAPPAGGGADEAR